MQTTYSQIKSGDQFRINGSLKEFVSRDDAEITGLPNNRIARFRAVEVVDGFGRETDAGEETTFSVRPFAPVTVTSSFAGTFAAEADYYDEDDEDEDGNEPDFEAIMEARQQAALEARQARLEKYL
jgi:hypothetical protein